MDNQRAIELLKIERECINRNNQPFGQNCDRKCSKCDLVQNTDELIEMYDWVIGYLERENKIHQLVDFFDTKQKMCSNGKPCTHPNCRRCGTTHFMSDCDYGKEHNDGT